MKHLLCPGVKPGPNLVTMVAELQENVRKISFDNLPNQHCNAVYLRMRVHVGIIPNEPNSCDVHHRLSEQFLYKYAGYAQYLDWENSVR